MTREEALQLLLRHPAQVGRWCGYPRLTDELHGEWIRQMLGGTDDATLLAHRGSYKTTCLSMALATLMCVSPLRSMMLLRKTDADAAELLRQVRKIIASDAMQYLTAAVYRSPVVMARGTADGLTCDCFAAPRGSAQLTGCGIGAALTGKHAELVFTDDIVTVADRVSEAERERTRQVYMELQNIRSPGGRIFNIGTPWHKDDAISLMPDVKRYDCYETQLLTERQIAALRESMTPSLFAANYELRHISGDGALFDGAPVFAEDSRMIRGGIAHIDAADGGDDFTALTCGKRVGDTIYLYGRLWRRHVDAVLEECIDACSRLTCSPVSCESNADKGYLAKMLRSRFVRVRQYHENMNKEMKIATHLRKWWKRIVFIPGTDAEYIAQIIDYTAHAAHADAPDSAACMCRLLDKE